MSKIIKYKVLIKDNDKIGLSDIAYTTYPYERYIPETYIDEINEIIDIDDYDKIGEGKLYGLDCKNPIEALNEILKYWFVKIKSIENMPEILKFESIKDAINYLKLQETKFIVFEIIYTK